MGFHGAVSLSSGKSGHQSDTLSEITTGVARQPNFGADLATSLLIGELLPIGLRRRMSLFGRKIQSHNDILAEL